MRDDMNYKRDRAVGLIQRAVKNGDLTRPEACELCGSVPGFQITFRRDVGEVSIPLIHAHHWNGYDDPLNVWWLCYRCNTRLKGRRFHVGELSKEDVMAFLFDNL